VIQDLQLAPRNARGMVEYSMGISILKPVDLAKGNRTLLYETVNRGNKNLPFLNIGGDGQKAGDGFLQRQGYTLAWSGWEGDITTGIRISLPIAVNPDGSPITGRVRAEYILVNSTSTVDVTRHPAYQAASLDNTGAVLTRRVHQADPREPIDNSKWAFADCAATPFPGKPDGGKVCLEGGFDTNHIYELVYTAKDPTVAGLGFAATRDFGAFLRGDTADQSVANPLAGGIDHTLIFGSSQSGRWIRTFIHLGFNESESHKRVFDGAIPHKASNRGTFNVRFAQSTRLSGTQHTEAQYPGQESPQTFDVSTDPIAGVTGGQLDRCRKSQTCPKVTATVTDTEYWQAFMALNTTDAAGKKDLPIPPEVRLYHFAGTQHGGGDQLRQPPSVQPKPPLDCLPVRAASWLLTRGWAGSSCIGLVPPGTTEKSVWKVSHPALLDEKSGGDAFCCAAPPAVSEAKAKPVNIPPATNFAVEVRADIFPSLNSAQSCEQLRFNVTTIASHCGREGYGPNWSLWPH
jgi:Alpha/beta hydrolase domain